MRRLVQSGALVLAALAPLACEEGGPLEAPPTPRAILTPTGATPSPEEIDLCKEGTAGSYNFTLSVSPGPGGLVNDGADGSADVAAGTCEVVGFSGGAADVVTVTENVPPGLQAAGVVTRTAFTGTNTTTGVMSGFGGEGAVITFFNGPIPPPPGGGEGCTPGYWKQPQHADSWPAPYTPDTPFSDVFSDAFPGMTLVEVAAQGGGHLNALGRHTVAALLNAASAGVSYDLTVADVIAGFNAAFASGDYSDTHKEFEGFNEQGCPLN